MEPSDVSRVSVDVVLSSQTHMEGYPFNNDCGTTAEDQAKNNCCFCPGQRNAELGSLTNQTPTLTLETHFLHYLLCSKMERVLYRMLTIISCQVETDRMTMHTNHKRKLFQYRQIIKLYR